MVERIKASGSQIEVTGIVFEFEEDGVFYAFSPSLDITGYGNSKIEARQSFKLMVEEFITHTQKKGTLSKVLKLLGWKVNTNKTLIKAALDKEVYNKNPDMLRIMHIPHEAIANSMEIAY